MTTEDRLEQAERLLAYADRLLAHYMLREHHQTQPAPRVFDDSDNRALQHLLGALDEVTAAADVDDARRMAREALLRWHNGG